jgi:5-methylcytosine-specific restriction endonuclease McrA
VRYGKTPEELDSRACERCGARIGDSTRGGRRKYCTPCGYIAMREYQRDARRIRRARERGVEREPYTMEYIAMRDQYRCGICGDKVAMSEPVPHPKAATIDHLIPISEGGPDTKANVQLAHFICNSYRGAGGTVQLALIG